MTGETTYETLKLVRRDGIAVVGIDRAAKMNAISQQMIRDFNMAISELMTDLDTRAVVISGADHVFSAGIDLKDPEKWKDEEQALERRRETAFLGGRLCRAIESLPQITICAINGPAIGAGAAIALACDWRILGQSAYFWLPEIRIGLNLSWGAVPRLTMLAGPARAKRMLVLCEKLAARTALDWGLADEVVNDPLERSMEIAADVASMPPTPVRISKETVNTIAYAMARAIGHADGDQGLVCRDSKDARTARAAFGK